ncbi:MAG TPA: hypothetical protein VEN81_10610, partial [Planctomycetota bacterium]|nr:hypothetical protein [Planctomycetota bacterium]
MTVGIASILAAWASASPLFAQADPQKKYLEDERRREMDERADANADLKQDFLWEYGGWFHSEVDYLNDQPYREHRLFGYEDLRLWGELVYDRHYTAYVRLQTDYTDFSGHQQFTGDDHTRYRPAVVDQAWMDADFSWEGTLLKARAGKEFESMGSGLLLEGVYYGAHVSWASGPFSARLLVAHTIVHEDDLDQSLPNFHDSRRGFAGVELDWRFSGDHTFYGMGLLEHDFNDAENAFQKWDYNPDYVGLGARGHLVDNLYYAAEGVFEFGKTMAAGATTTDAIQAFAALLTLDYVWHLETSPTLEVQYMFGSGDKHRASATDVASGSPPGTKDESFLAFGFVQTGYSLFPLLANIHIVRAGGSFHPLESLEAVRTLEL